MHGPWRVFGGMVGAGVVYVSIAASGVVRVSRAVLDPVPNAMADPTSDRQHNTAPRVRSFVVESQLTIGG